MARPAHDRSAVEVPRIDVGRASSHGVSVWALARRWWLLGATLAGLRGRSVEHGHEVFVATDREDGPIASLYAHAAQPTVVPVPLAACRGLWFAAFRCDVDGDHPYVRTMVDFGQGTISSYTDSPLRTYFERWCPRTAAEALGVGRTWSGGIAAFLTLPPEAAMAPWWPTCDLARFANAVRSSTERENVRAGSTLSAAAGSHLHGPVTAAKGDVEFQRCVRVFTSVQSHGFVCDHETLDGDVRGQVLVRDDGSYAVMILSGQHRIAAAAALGYRTAPVRFQHGAHVGMRLVHRGDVRHWPGVRSGLFSEDAALAVFDRVFTGRQPWHTA